jgi:hypothetical protein
MALQRAQEEHIWAANSSRTCWKQCRGAECQVEDRQHRQAVYQNLVVDTFNANIRVHKLTLLFQAPQAALFAWRILSSSGSGRR